ncbi:DNA-binding response regulator [Paenibacillus sambharensis]|uniref:DNA-binding response regulator n=1 Tax=Paenibacillus sambharensis TaxID=1803190 RepID=A0A2W1LGY0_9BACL|nr:response regulator [Paenibacillus sambharensis]PZD94302.1 DNA-binding response regulator [Paenibacillus sambharensis]
MNILIVDDEQHAREAVKLLVDWNSYGITRQLEADNGEQAKQMIVEHRPELVLTDMHMPISDGRALLEWIAGHYPDIKIIVISGYSDFDYMRHAIKYGGSDYLLKPLDPDQLNESVRKSVEAARKSREDKLKQSAENIERNQFKPVYWDNVFTRMASDSSIPVQLIEQVSAEFSIPSGGTTCRAVICSLEPLPPLLVKRFREDRELIAFAMTNILNDFVRLNWKSGYAFRIPSQSDAVYVVLWDGLSMLERRLRELQDALAATMGARLHFGTGGVQAFPSGLKQSAREAREALHRRNLLDGNQFLHFYDKLLPPAGKRPHLSDIEEAVRLAILSRSETEIAAAIRRWSSEAAAMTILTPADVESWQQEYRLLYSRWTQSLADNSDSIPKTAEFPAAFQDDGKFSLRETEQAILRHTVALAETMAAKKRSERNVINDILQYIEQNINDDLSLFAVASKFYLSREYISRRFRQETGTTLSEYVERMRMDKAKLLLGNAELRITDVAGMVGYSDDKYFSKVFKKQTGVSPGQYRKNVHD